MARMKKQVQDVIDQEIESAAQNEEVLDLTEETATNQPKEPKAYVNPIVKAGHTLEAIQEQFKTKSAAIRFLGKQGFKTGDIAKFFPGNGPGGRMRYQHARNVLTQKLKGTNVEGSDSSSETETE